MVERPATGIPAEDYPSVINSIKMILSATLIHFDNLHPLPSRPFISLHSHFIPIQIFPLPGSPDSKSTKIFEPKPESPDMFFFLP